MKRVIFWSVMATVAFVSGCIAALAHDVPLLMFNLVMLFVDIQFLNYEMSK